MAGSRCTGTISWRGITRPNAAMRRRSASCSPAIMLPGRCSCREPARSARWITCPGGSGFTLTIARSSTAALTPRAVDRARHPLMVVRGPFIAGERCLAVLGAAATFAVPFAAFTSLVLYHFYVRCSFLLDSGLLAYLAAHGGAALPTPHVLRGQSFFATHLTPVFFVTEPPRRWLPGYDPQFL